MRLPRVLCPNWKWHLGHNEPFSPTYRGFDSWYGLPFSGDMGCIDTTPQGCKPEWSRTQGQPACPALCVPENASNPAAIVGIPLYDSTGTNCSSRASCNDDILSQPFNPMTLNAQYAARAKSILAQYATSNRNASSSSGTPTRPFLLYMAFAHTHTPLGYNEARFGNTSSRPGWAQVFGNTLAEVDDAVGQVHTTLEKLGLANNTVRRTRLVAPTASSDSPHRTARFRVFALRVPLSPSLTMCTLPPRSLFSSQLITVRPTLRAWPAR